MHGLLISFVATAVGQPMSLVATDLEQFAAMYQALALAAEIAPTEAFAGTTGTCCCMVDSDGPYPYPCTVGEACTCPFFYGGESGCKGSGISSVCEAPPAQERKSAAQFPPWGNISGFADSVVYSFQNTADTKHFVTLLEPLASYVRDHEQAITWTFRPFVSADGLSVLIFERFIDKAAHDGPHSNSAVHLKFKATVAAWNASTHAITNKLHSDWNETIADGEAFGIWDRKSPSSVGVSGFTHSVLYSFKDASLRADFMLMLRVWTRAVRDNEEQTTFTFRPFLSTDDGLSALVLERFPTKAAYDDPLHSNSSGKQTFDVFESVWQDGTHGVTSTVHEDWQELAMGVLSREAGQLLTTGSVLV